MSEGLYWIWLSTTLGAGSGTFLSLLDKFGSPFEIYNASEDEILRALTPDVPAEQRDAGSKYYEKTERADKIALLLANKNLETAYKIIEYCTVNNYGILAYSDPRYPSRLKQLRNPPSVLYFRGIVPDFERRVCISMVGTRDMSDYGRSAAYTIAYELAAAGAIVISGMALGVDGVCAAAALAAGGTTAAVLGCGIDITYPPGHGRLMSYIERSGVILSEYSPATPPYGKNFPVRNRIISGLSQGTLVVEANMRSGALITAREALYQGRELYAVPGKLSDAGSAGTNNLIIDGAQMVRCAADILNNYKYLYGGVINFRRLTEAETCSRLNEEVIRMYGVSVPVKKQSARAGQADNQPPMPVNNSAQYAYNSINSANKSGQGEYNPRQFAYNSQQPAYNMPLYNESRIPPDRFDSSLRVSSPFKIPDKFRNSAASDADAATASSVPVSGNTPRSEIFFANEIQRDVYRQIPPDRAVGADEIVRSGINISEVTMALTMLEIQGHIRSLPGGLFIRK